MMTAIMKKHLKKNKKGFTLIEVVVVLVILAVLVAIAVPALTGYIDDANERAVASEARTALVGLQHMASTDADDTGEYFVDGGNAFGNEGAARLNTLTGSTTIAGNVTAMQITKGTVLSFTYDNGKKSIGYTEADGFGTPGESTKTP